MQIVFIYAQPGKQTDLFLDKCGRAFLWPGHGLIYSQLGQYAQSGKAFISFPDDGGTPESPSEMRHSFHSTTMATIDDLYAPIGKTKQFVMVWTDIVVFSPGNDKHRDI